MTFRPLSMTDLWKAIGVGVVTAVLLTAVMLPAFKFGIAPMPKFPSLAFAEAILGRPLPLPIGLLFHGKHPAKAAARSDQAATA